MLEVNDLTKLDYSILLILLSIIVYYFGKFIGDTKVEKFDKDGYYIEGFFFFIYYVVIPFAIALFINNYLGGHQELLSTLRVKLSGYPLGILLIQMFVLKCLSTNVKANKYFNRYGLLKKCSEDSERKVNGILNKLGPYTTKLSESYTNQPSELFDLINNKIPTKVFGNKKVLYIFSFVTIYSSFHLFNHTNSPLIITISLLLTLVTVTNIAISIGYHGAYYPTGKIFLVDGTVFEGKILKFGKYVSLLKDEKKIFINEDRINYVEENLFKEKENK